MNEKLQLKNQGDSIFALDIGTRTVVGVYGESKDENFILKDYVIEPHPKRAMIDGQIEDIRKVAKIVAKVKNTLEERNGIKFKDVSVAAAGRALKTRQEKMSFDISEHTSITLDMIKSMELEVVQKAGEELNEEYKGTPTFFYCVGHSVISYHLDGYKIMNLEGHKGLTAEVELIATFLPSVVIEGLYSVMEHNNLEISTLTLEPIAAMNVIIPQEIRLINIALVDIGAGTSDIAISKEGSIVAYAMATIAGDEITEEIIKTFFVDFSTAEKMKHDSTGKKTEIIYRDIFGLSQSVSIDDFNKKIDGSVSLLAKTICENIIAVNGGPTAAVFLVGGGSLISGLAEKVAEILKLDSSRVAIGTSANFRMVDTGTFDLGAEYATPLGIAVTNILNKGYDFSLIELNGSKVRIFDTKKISIFDLLTMVGYKTYDIVGRSGRNLTFTLGGRHRVIKGGAFTPAEITINGKESSIHSHVSQGDKVEFKPAISGGNASATIGDVYGFALNKDSYVIFGGEEVSIGATFSVRGKSVDENYQIKPLDVIETSGILTLGDLLKSLNIDIDGNAFMINGEVEPLTTILSDGDIIDYDQSGIISSIPKIDPKPSFEDIETEFSEEIWGGIIVNLNGKEIQLPPTSDKTPHLFIEVLNHIDYEPNNVSGYKMTLNGEETSFNQQIKTGDIIEIELK